MSKVIARYLLHLLKDIRERYGNVLQASDLQSIDETIETADAELSRGRGRPVGTPARPAEFDIDEAAGLRAAGLSFAAIGRRLGVTKQAIHAGLKRAEQDNAKTPPSGGTSRRPRDSRQ